MLFSQPCALLRGLFLALQGIIGYNETAGNGNITRREKI
jgi:hypothetical protein